MKSKTTPGLVGLMALWAASATAFNLDETGALTQTPADDQSPSETDTPAGSVSVPAKDETDALAQTPADDQSPSETDTPAGSVSVPATAADGDVAPLGCKHEVSSLAREPIATPAKDTSTLEEVSTGIVDAPTVEDAPTLTESDAPTPAGRAQATELKPFALKPYIAEYSVQYYGYAAGNMTVIMGEKDDYWERQNIALPTGLATMLVDTVTETSRFFFDPDKSIQPISYYIHNTEKSKWIKNLYDNETQEVTIESANVKSMGEGRLKIIHPNPHGRVYDETNWMIQAAQDYLLNRLPCSYEVVGFSGLRTYKVVFERMEDYRIGDTAHRSVLLKRIRNEKDYVLIWLSTDMNYIPLNLERHKKNKLLLKVELMVAAFD